MGRPGWTSDSHLSLGLPWSFGALVRSGWEVADAVTSDAAPAPGILEAQTPLAWADSAAVVIGEDSGWRGFGAGVARAETFVRPGVARKPRAVFTFVNGGSAIERNSLFLARSDRRHWLRIGSTGQRRGGVGELDLSGEHLWTFDGGVRRGAHAYRAQFTQRGMGASLAYPLRESGSGQSGELGWDWARARWRSSFTLERGFDARSSSDANFGSAFLDSRRDAQQSRVIAELSRGTPGERLEGVRLWARQGRVVRVYASGTRTEWDERAFWGASRVQRPWQGGVLELQLGAGYSDAPARRSERAQLAPGVVWRYLDPSVRLKLFAERVVDPVWSDLATGVQPFVQDTWVGGIQSAVGSTQRHWAEGSLVLGRTGGKATLVPLPLRDVQLRLGYLPESRRKEFTLATIEAGWRTRAGALEASTFALARDRDGQRWVDPGTGARLAAETGFRAFTGDLLVRLRVQGAYVGPRETDIHVISVTYDDRVLPGFTTLSAMLWVTLGDATIAIRADNLEDERRPEVWLDFATGREALGAGRQVRAEVTWPFFN